MLSPRTLPLLVAAVLATVSVLAVVVIAAADRDRADTARVHALEQTSQATAALGELLKARISNIAGLFNASERVEADEFAAFTEPMLRESRAASLSYVEVVTAAERAAYERRTGRIIREVTPTDRRVRAADRPRYAVATYTTIGDGSEELLGTDALSRRPDATAIAAATLSGKPQSTTAIWLPATREAGAVLYVPVYGSAGARRPGAGPRRPIGYIAAAFRFRDFAPVLAPLVPRGTSASLEIAGAPAFKIGQIRGEVSRSEQVIAGRTWQIAVSSPPPAKQAFGLTRAQTVGVFLGLLTLLITLLTRQAVAAARSAQELAELRQRERDQAVRNHQTDRAASHELLSHLPNLSVLRFDEQLRVVDVSGGLVERAGWTQKELLGADLTELYDEWGQELIEALHGALVGEISAFPGKSQRVGGLHYWVQVLPVPGDGGLLVTSDVTSLIGAESERAKAQSRFERLFASAPVGMALVNPSGEFVQVNEALAEISGYATRELLQMGPPDLVHPDDAQASREQLSDLFTGAAAGLSTEKRYRHAEGHTIWGALNATVLHDPDGHPEYVLAHLIDVTERHEIAEQLEHLANHDPLTNLRNRRSFEAALDRQIASTRRYHEPAALLMVDLDHFKAVNDTRGHQAGDRVLVDTADLLRDELRESDTVARLGGDEFAVLLPRATAEEAVTVAEKLTARLHAYGESLPTDPLAPALTASVGVAILAGQHRSIDEALADADNALYRVKTSGRDGFDVAGPRTSHTV
ncbi:MAG: diguanylate cyclase [Solirubrobacteraceae bacterium]|nr:diguanylate cyclase [Solirubrobacteraceae bacterium]